MVDALVEQLIAADTRDELVTLCRALDRVLQWGFYMIPHWHIDYDRIAYRSDLSHPDDVPPYAFGGAPDIWWAEPQGE